MDIYQLILQNNLSYYIGNFFGSNDASDINTTLLYFYSTVAQSMAALFTVSGFFAIYRLQAIDVQLSRSYSAFREWISIRLNCAANMAQADRSQLQERFAEQGLELWGLGVDIEPHSWLEKDIPANAKSLYEAAKKHKSYLMKALRDYYRHFYTQNILSLLVKILSFVPLVVTGLLLLDALTQISYLHLQKSFDKLYYIKDVVAVLVWTKCLLVYFFFYAVIAILGIPEINDNNMITNRASGAPTFFKRILEKLTLFWKSKRQGRN